MTDSARQLVSLVDVREHARRRRPWNRAFSSASLKEFTPVIANRVHQLVTTLRSHDGQVVDLAMWISYYAYVDTVLVFDACR